MLWVTRLMVKKCEKSPFSLFKISKNNILLVKVSIFSGSIFYSSIKRHSFDCWKTNLLFLMMKNCQRNDAEFQTPYFSAPSACAVHLHWLDWTHCSILHRFEWGKLTVSFHGCQVGSCEEFLYPLMISCSYGIDGPFIDDLLSCMMIPHDFFGNISTGCSKAFTLVPWGFLFWKKYLPIQGSFTPGGRIAIFWVS